MSTDLAAVLAPLLPKPSFGVFMEGIAELADRALAECGDHRTLEHPRLTAAALAELAVYEDMLAIYEGHHHEWRTDLEERPPMDQNDKAGRFREAMTVLLYDDNFESLMAYFRTAKREATKTARVNAHVAGTQRLLKALGAINAYRDIVGIQQYHLQFVPQSTEEVA